MAVGIFQNKSGLEREWDALLKKEDIFLRKRAEKKDSVLNQKLEEKIPGKLQMTLDAAFEKAFALIFEKGTHMIEKTYRREKLEKDYKIRQYAADIKKDRKSLRKIMKQAGNSGAKNLLLSGASGISMGVLGIGLPDIPLFTGMVLKNIYEIALNYGYGYESEKERLYILLLIQGAVSYGEEMQAVNRKIDQFIDDGTFPESCAVKQQMKASASTLSNELLYMKFLQGIPVVGAIGGAYDAIYMKRISEYTQLKYQRRFLSGQKKKKQE